MRFITLINYLLKGIILIATVSIIGALFVSVASFLDLMAEPTKVSAMEFRDNVLLFIFSLFVMIISIIIIKWISKYDN
jgi:uncharacterized membrane protein